jgi:hypothetical protein
MKGLGFKPRDLLGADADRSAVIDKILALLHDSGNDRGDYSKHVFL